MAKTFLKNNIKNYLLNHWCGLAPLWASFHLGDQGRHGRSSVYENWKNVFSKIQCIQDRPKTQGIVKYHHKSLKHIEVPKRRNRLDNIVKQLFDFNVSKHRQYAINFSHRKKTGKLLKIKTIFEGTKRNV